MAISLDRRCPSKTDSNGYDRLDARLPVAAIPPTSRLWVRTPTGVAGKVAIWSSASVICSACRWSPMQQDLGNLVFRLHSHQKGSRPDGDTTALGIIEAVKPAALPAATTNLRHLISSARPRPVHGLLQRPSAGGQPEVSTTFVVAALVTGNSRLACGVALAEIVTKTALYYVHERAWAPIPWGRR
jgi:predicted membrane protein DUF2061